MRNIKLVMEYDGTDYHGWQCQLNAPTIQEVMEDRLSRMLNEKIRVSASGRTDAGVHALNQVANFKTCNELPCNVIHKGINAFLPEDIIVKEVAEAQEGFHSRYSAIGKVYIYQILTAPYNSAFRNRYCWHVRHALDIESMNEAAGCLEGEHDFSSFRASSCGAPHPVKTVISAFFREKGGLLIFEIEASGFLHHMVRNIVGSLVEVGSGRRRAGWFRDIFLSKDRKAAGVTAPPQGLFLKEVKY